MTKDRPPGRLDPGAPTLEAAAQGMGVALRHESRFAHARDPRLVKLFGVEVESPCGYRSVCAPARSEPARCRCSAAG